MKKVLTHLFISTILFSPVLVFAQVGLKNPINVNSISDLILIVTRVVRYIAIPFVVVMIMYSGFKFMWAYRSLSGVNAGELTDAKKSLTYTVIGAFILLSSELIALVMKNTITSLTN